MSSDLRPSLDTERPEGDHALSLLGAVMALPGRDRNALLAFLDFWRELPGEERAIFARSVRPDLTDAEVARLAGVSRRTLYRWERYQAFKPRLEDYKATRRRRWSEPDDDAA